MPNFTVSTDVDSFMQGADSAAMQASLSLIDGSKTNLGSGSVASGLNASAFGYKNTASGLNTVAVGNNVHATEPASVNVGILNNTTGGTLNTSTGAITGTVVADTAQVRFSTAVGIDNTTSGIFSSAVGYNNTASGLYSSAVGYRNTASGYYYPSAVGYLNTASGYYSSAVGYNNTASGLYNSSAVGYNNTASGHSSSAVGSRNTASGLNTVAVGYRTKTTVGNTIEVGYWNSASTRTSSIRMHPDKQVAFTIKDSATAPTDGGAVDGSESNGTLGRSMYSLQKNGTAVTMYFNNAGTIQSLSLGTLS